MGLLLLLSGSFSGALDSLGTGLESAWSVGRRLRTGYSGAVIRVRRSSDNAESDFSGSGASGAVDPAAVAAFCGAGDGFLTTIYDQSGNARNWTQATTTIQPLVVSSGVANTQNSRLVARWNGATSNRKMTVASSTATYKFLHTTGGTLAFMLSHVDNADASKCFLGSSNGSVAGVFLYLNGSERVAAITARRDVAGVATNGATIDATATSRAISTTGSTVFMLLDPDNATAGSRASVWVDGTAPTGFVNAQTATPFNENAFADIALGNASTFNQSIDGNIGEVIFWSGDATSGRTTWESNAKTFWGTP